MLTLLFHISVFGSIKWTSPPNLDTVELYLTQSGTPLNHLLYSGEDDNSFLWQINSNITAGSGYQIIVVDSDSSGATDTLSGTSGEFQIFDPQPTVTVTSIFTHQLGAIWVRGQNATIHFTSRDPLDLITFEIHDQDGNVVYVVAADVPAYIGNYTLDIPYQAPPSDCFSCFLVGISSTYPENYHTVSKSWFSPFLCPQACV